MHDIEKEETLLSSENTIDNSSQDLDAFSQVLLDTEDTTQYNLNPRFLQIQPKQSENAQNTEKLSVFGAAMAFLSTIIGGGVVGLPFSFYHSGIPFGIILNIVFALQTIYSCHLIIQAKELTGGLCSFSEIGYLLMGRKSIFLVNGIIFIGAFQLIMIYFIVIGDICSSFFSEFTGKPEGDKYYTSRSFYVAILAFFIIGFIFKKEVHEFKFASYMLFLSIVIFIIICALEMIIDGNHWNTDKDYSQYYKLHFDRQLFTAISVFITAYGFQSNIFPVIRSMKEPTNENCIKAVSIAVFSSMGIYITLSFLGIYMFGSAIRPDLMDSIGEEGYHFTSIAQCMLFFFVILFHIPFVFFYGRENFLQLIDEIDRQSISINLQQQLASYQQIMSKSGEMDQKILKTNIKVSYYDMNTYYYHFGTLIIFILQVIGAAFIKDIGIIFQIGAAIAGSSCQFIIPGLFYILAETKFGAKAQRSERKLSICLAYLNVIVGLIFLISLLVGTFINIVADSEEGVHGG
eukprot:403374242